MKAKQIDRVVTKAAAYKSAVNPFEYGTRQHRYFNAARKHYESMEAQFRDLELVYGPIEN